MLVLGRLLGPSEFGLIGMALFFVGIGQLITDFGIGSAIVQAQSHDRVVLSSCFWLNLGIAITLCAMLIAGAPLVGRFYGRPDVVPVVMVLSAALVLNAMQTVPASLLYRQMRFRVLTLSQLAGSFLGSLVAIVLAYLGAGVWALVVQTIVGTLTTLFSYAVAQRWLPHFEFSASRVAALARFSGALFATRLLDYAHRSADSVLVGRVLGAESVGLYSVAVQVMLYPLQQVSSVFVKVLFPVLVQLRGDLPRLRSAYLQAVSSIALVTFPLMGGLFVLANDFVSVVFGPKWAELTSLLRVLSWVGMMQSVAATMGTLYISTGNAALALRVTMVATPVVIAGMAAGLPWGIYGVAVGYACASFSLFYYTGKVAFRLVGLDFKSFFAVLWGSSAATAIMIATLYFALPVGVEWEPHTRLLLFVLLGACTYAAATWHLNRAQLLEVYAAIRTLRERR
jgi:O-antigen/teichoic acid export membrane protein